MSADVRMAGSGGWDGSAGAGASGEAGDPFGTAGLRAAVLAAWRDSPTRLREDAAAEADLVRAGYRDRVLTELAQNAADAAAAGGMRGDVAVRLDGRLLSVSNTGAPLDLSGVHALTALRASGKSESAGEIGRFGVGFTAVLAVSEDIEIRSTTGSLRFSRDLTRTAIAETGVQQPDAEGEFPPPVLRLAWPTQQKPVSGADTEVVLNLRDDVDTAALLAGMRAEAVDLLLELPGLHRIRINGDEFRSVVRDLPAPGLSEVRIIGPLSGSGAESGPDVVAGSHLSVDFPTSVVPETVADPNSGTRVDPAPDLGSALGSRVDPVAPTVADPYSGTPMDPAAGRTSAPGPRVAPTDTGDSDPLDRGAATGTGGDDPLDLGFGVESTHESDRVWWQFRTERARWLLPVRGGTPVPVTPDVLRAPTRSDEELSLPALLIADIPMQPDRRRILPGARVADLVSGYAAFARALPPRDRLTLVPAPGFARSEVDSLLREAVLHELRTTPWLPVVTPTPGPTHDSFPGSASAPTGSVPTGSVAAGFVADDSVRDDSVRDDSVLNGFVADKPEYEVGADRERVAVPERTTVFPGITRELTELLADIVDPLLIPDLSGDRYAEALAVLGVHRLGPARLAELTSGLDRDPRWWSALYNALEPFTADPLAVEELGALAVPLADGRLVTGPRTVVLDTELAALPEPIPVHWARLVHPAAAHPLLTRLGARTATVSELLSDPALHAELLEHPDDPDLVDAVLRLAAAAPENLPPWLSLVELTDSTGSPRAADELLLPGAPLAELLIPDSPFGTVDDPWVEHYGVAALRAVGVGWDFQLVSETDPTGPDHDLDEEDTWWSGLAADPPRLLAVRDLDLVDDAAWPEALWRLLTDPRTRPLLADPDGYTAWWLRHYARIDGVPLGAHRRHDDHEFADLLPELPVMGLSADDLAALHGCLADPAAIDVSLARVLLDALADPAKNPTAEAITRTHTRLAAAVPHLELSAVEPPDRVRCLAGGVVDAGDALILDRPWFGLAVPPDRLVPTDPDTAGALAALLDLPLVSERVTAEVVGTGHETTWAAEPLGVVLRRMFTLPPQDGPLVVHDELRLRLHGAVERTVAVPWWRDGAVTHIRRPHPAHH